MEITDESFSLFDNELRPDDYSFYLKHQDTFKRLWQTEKKEFWLKVILAFRGFSQKHDVISKTKKSSDRLRCLVYQEDLYVKFHQKLIEGKFGDAKDLLENLAIVSMHQHALLNVVNGNESKTANPFYKKETRNAFRSLFGEPTASTTITALTSCSIISRFGGTICSILKSWIECACSDCVFFQPPKNLYIKSDEMFDITVFECHVWNYWKDKNLTRILTMEDKHLAWLSEHSNCDNCGDKIRKPINYEEVEAVKKKGVACFDEPKQKFNQLCLQFLGTENMIYMKGFDGKEILSTPFNDILQPIFIRGLNKYIPGFIKQIESSFLKISILEKRQLSTDAQDFSYIYKLLCRVNSKLDRLNEKIECFEAGVLNYAYFMNVLPKRLKTFLNYTERKINYMNLPDNLPGFESRPEQYLDCLLILKYHSQFVKANKETFRKNGTFSRHIEEMLDKTIRVKLLEVMKAFRRNYQLVEYMELQHEIIDFISEVVLETKHDGITIDRLEEWRLKYVEPIRIIIKNKKSEHLMVLFDAELKSIHELRGMVATNIRCSAKHITDDFLSPFHICEGRLAMFKALLEEDISAVDIATCEQLLEKVSKHRMSECSLQMYLQEVSSLKAFLKNLLIASYYDAGLEVKDDSVDCGLEEIIQTYRTKLKNKQNNKTSEQTNNKRTSKQDNKQAINDTLVSNKQDTNKDNKQVQDNKQSTNKIEAKQDNSIKDNKQSNNKEDNSKRANNKQDNNKQANNKHDNNKQANNKQDNNKQANNKQDTNKQANSKQDTNKQADNKQDLNKQANNKQDNNKQANNKQDNNKQANNKHDNNKQANNKQNTYKQANNKHDNNKQVNNKQDYSKQVNNKQDSKQPNNKQANNNPKVSDKQANDKHDNDKQVNYKHNNDKQTNDKHDNDKQTNDKHNNDKQVNDKHDNDKQTNHKPDEELTNNIQDDELQTDSREKQVSKKKQKAAKKEMVSEIEELAYKSLMMSRSGCDGCDKPKEECDNLGKCQKCVQENKTNPRKYCSRECQALDWRLRHRREHQEMAVKNHKVL